MPKQNRRQTVMINRSFQIKMISKFIALNVVLLVIFSVMIYFFLDSEVDSNLFKAHVTFQNIREILLPIVITLSVVNILISTIVISGFVFFASFRIAGPLYRFNEIIKDIGEGRLDTITSLRKNDQLYECSVTLQETISRLTADMGRMKEIAASLENEPDREGAAELKQILDRYAL